MSPTAQLVVFGLVSGAVLLAAGSGLAAEPDTTADLAIHAVDAKEALPALRALAGVMDPELVDLHTVRVTGNPEELALARAVVELIETAGPDAPRVATREGADGSRIARVAVTKGTSRQALGELRRLGVRKIAALDSAGIVLMRDSPKQVEVALEALRSF